MKIQSAINHLNLALEVLPDPNQSAALFRVKTLICYALDNLVAKNLIIFKPKIEVLEVEFEGGMVAEFLRKEDMGEGMIKCVFSTKGFDEINDPLMKRNYWDNKGEACLTAKEAGCWPHNDEHGVWMMEGEEGEYFEAFNG